MNPAVTSYIKAASEAQEPLLQALRLLIHRTVPLVQEDFKWGRPVFRSTRNFAYLKSEKQYVTLGFYDARMLKDPSGTLEGSGVKMRHVKLPDGAAIDEKQLAAWLLAASV